MEKIFFFISIFICLNCYFSFVQCQKTPQNYTVPKLTLESFCGRGEAERAIKIDEWKTLILEAGFVSDPKHRHHIKNCQIKIRTAEGFGLVAAIEHMKIRAQTNSRNNKRICEDYIQFSIPPRNIIDKFFTKYDFPFYTKKESEELCGVTTLDAKGIDGSRITDLSTGANSYSSPYHKLNFLFHQVYQPTGSVNNSFNIVLTSYRKAKDDVFKTGCEDKFVCKNKPTVCIDPALVCDGHVNCAFPGSGMDESKCSDGEQGYKTSTILLISIVCVVATIIFLICVYCACNSRMKKADSEFDITSITTQHIRGMSRGTQASLIAYLSGERPGQSATAPEPPKEEFQPSKEDLPPSYEALFPVESQSSSKPDSP